MGNSTFNTSEKKPLIEQSFTLKVHHIDVLNLVFHGRLFDLTQDVVENFLNSKGFGYDRIAKEEFTFPVVHCEAEFLKPMRIGNKVTCKMYLEKIGRSSLIRLHEFCSPTGEILSKVRITCVCVCKQTWKSMEIPAEFREIFS